MLLLSLLLVLLGLQKIDDPEFVEKNSVTCWIC